MLTSVAVSFEQAPDQGSFSPAPVCPPRVLDSTFVREELGFPPLLTRFVDFRCIEYPSSSSAPRRIV